MNARTSQHREWGRELVQYLKKVRTCERCRMRPATDHAHRLKRRFLGWRLDGKEGRPNLDRLEYFMAAKLCRRCHTDLDEYKGEGAHERMFTVVTRIVLGRSRRVITGVYMDPHPLRVWEPERIYNYER